MQSAPVRFSAGHQDATRRDGKHERLSKLLHEFSFTQHQIKNIMSHLIALESRRTEIDLKVIKDAATFYLSKMVPPNLHPSDLEEIGDDFDWRKVTVQYVVSREPDLLLACPLAMEQRLAKLLDVGFMAGKRDVYRCFVLAPRAFFLQDWVEFQKKYQYIQHRFLDWLLDKRDKAQVPHPCVKHPKVFEMSYEHIKARHLFAQRTGLKSTSVATKLDKIVELDLGKLVLTELTDYLRTVAPSCSEEEYLVFEQMVSDFEDEDDEILAEVAELAGSQVTTQAKADKKKHFLTLRLANLDN
ncbi:hypothetical protein HDE_08761 [Halotydeus destructor]|nr:hypothetical protein HDE_08761 [Halotydeus destructor]